MQESPQELTPGGFLIWGGFCAGLGELNLWY